MGFGKSLGIFLNIQGNLELDQEVNGESTGRGFPYSNSVAAEDQLEQFAHAEACWGHRRNSCTCQQQCTVEMLRILAGHTEAQVLP